MTGSTKGALIGNAQFLMEMAVTIDMNISVDIDVDIKTDYPSRCGHMGGST